ncbi:peptidoglycan DD-metalloendopeptidase family protein [Winogradskyella endarachnes]|uniref:Peptidoglycan DD-metalloendopeptidase family protein n=1 Tax=Winogradskyella endarachnes TaxID=2681965 RepID=A0A6L6U8M3_9FLAO|nr:peptidoglycan DD-metalloendopeptidase family protein [Winogradskyella endarachnes]MUU78379.1 peptidoglycan DD-metalloendopeptidase family protein [Winogradskyella endarachnes]
MTKLSFQAFLKSLNTHSVIDAALDKTDYIALDLSINNFQLKSVDTSSSSELEQYIFNYIKTNKAKIAFGGYLEKRNIYQRSTYFNQQNSDSERNIHLGIDIWIKANTPIYAPLDGIIHSFNNNINYGDYGPTLILKHKFEEFEFYTLYGHLTEASLIDKSIGQKVKQGEQMATLGTAEVNGDYPPHLHFQIIKDIEGYKGDYPGVCSLLDLEYYKANCPNPNLLLKLK